MPELILLFLFVCFLFLQNFRLWGVQSFTQIFRNNCWCSQLVMLREDGTALGLGRVKEKQRHMGIALLCSPSQQLWAASCQAPVPVGLHVPYIVILEAEIICWWKGDFRSEDLGFAFTQEPFAMSPFLLNCGQQLSLFYKHLQIIHYYYFFFQAAPSQTLK